MSPVNQMKNLLRIYRIMIRHWVYLVGGLFFMLGYALFAGASLTMVIPVFDQVFKTNKPVILFTSTPEFLLALKLAAIHCLHGLTFFQMLNTDAWKPLLSELNRIMSLTDPYLLLATIVWFSLSVFILKNIFYYFNKLMFVNLQGKTIRDIRLKVFENYLRQTVAFANKNRVGDALVRLIQDVNNVSTQYIVALATILRDLAAILILLRIALLLNARLFLISMIVAPLFALALTYVGGKMKKYAKRLQNQYSILFSAVEEVLTSMKVVKAFSREDFEYRKVKQINQGQFKFWRKGEIYNAFNTPIGEMNGVIVGMVVLLIGGRMVLHNQGFTFGAFTAFLFAVFSMLRPFKEIAKCYMDVRRAYVSLERISVIMDLEPEIREIDSPVEKKTFERDIVLDDVSFAYEGETQVLDGVSLTIRKGERVALVGSSGSGKTTLANLLPRLYDATGGEIRIDGVPIRNLRISQLRSLFGLVTQEPILFNETVRFNVAYGTLAVVNDDRVREACRIAYADEFVEKMAQRYDTMLDARGANLSGGQKQRLCIARAVVGDPPILIFDEATSALDTESERRVQDAIDRATKNRTVVMIAHRLSTILSADQIVVMDHGKIVGAGPHEELLKTCDRYRTLYELQFGSESGES
jgi:ATP-binding cassette, subfamily B, bacterial MsbA